MAVVLLHGGSQEHAGSVICLCSSCAPKSNRNGPWPSHARLIVLDQPLNYSYYQYLILSYTAA